LSRQAKKVFRIPIFGYKDKKTLCPLIKQKTKNTYTQPKTIDEFTERTKLSEGQNSTDRMVGNEEIPF